MVATSNRALVLFAKGIADVVGADSELYRDVLRAVESDQFVDMMLAQASFDTLPGNLKREIAGRVDDLVSHYMSSGQPIEEMGASVIGALRDGVA